MRVVLRYGYTGHYLHQKVEGVGDDCEIKEYGEAEQDGKRGVFGLVLYPYGRDHEKQTLLVIHIDGKWVPTKEDEDKCQVCGKSVPLSGLSKIGTGVDMLIVCYQCGPKERAKRRLGLWT